MYILGINAYHPDSSACIIRDGQLIACAEEERFTRIKHWSGLPVEAVRFCLKEAGVSLKEIDHIGISRNPYANVTKKIWFILKKRPRLSFVKTRTDNLRKIKHIKQQLLGSFGFPSTAIKAATYYIEHHIAHMASSFFVSDFEQAAILSVDALGDFVSTMSGRGFGKRIEVIDRVFFPHSLGFFYTAGTQFLGFLKFGDEYKVMGLAAYGKPSYVNSFKKILGLEKEGKFKLNLKYFRHYSRGIEMSWYNQEPTSGILYSEKWKELFGQPRYPQEEITQQHKDIACSLQVLLEESYFHILNYLYRKTHLDTLCLAGGVALNCVASGKVFTNTPFKRLFIQPAASDAGTALGAAYYVYHQILKKPRCFVMEHAYWGPGCEEEQINKDIQLKIDDLKALNCKIERLETEQLINKTAELIAQGKIVGWFQGMMEWGPRALGNRSILADPRREEMKDILNARIKHREKFRPFAPSVLEEYTEEYFYYNHPSPFMLLSLPTKEDKIKDIISSVHVDGSARFQTVSKKTNPLFWQLIDKFRMLTGVAVVLNTSFNENEPIVCYPKEAIECFLRTRMDVLVIGKYIISR